MAGIDQNDHTACNKTVYIHTGYGRTATTWLQNNLFPNLNDLAYLGKTTAEYPRWLLEWNYLDRLLLPQAVPKIRSHMAAATAPQGVLLSSEAVTQTGDLVDQMERKLVVKRPSILLVLRDPTDLVV